MSRPARVTISIPMAVNMIMMTSKIVFFNVARHIYLLHSHAHVVSKNVAKFRLFKKKIITENSHFCLDLLEVVSCKMSALLDCFCKPDRSHCVVDEH